MTVTSWLVMKTTKIQTTHRCVHRDTGTQLRYNSARPRFGADYASPFSASHTEARDRRKGIKASARI